MMRFLQLAMASIFVGVMATSGFAFDIPELKGRVNDNAGLLSQTEQNRLTAPLHDLEDKTTAQVAILTVKQLPKGEDINSFKNKVFKEWKLGQKGKDNGILIVYGANADDGKDHYGIEIGYGLESVIPDAVAGDIIRSQLRAHADPKRGTHDFYAAFSGAVQVISEKIVAEANAQKVKASKPDTSNDPPTVVIVVVSLAVVGFAIFVLFGLSGFFNTKTPGTEESAPPQRRKPHEEEHREDQRHGRPIPPASPRRGSSRRNGDGSLVTGAILGVALSSGSRSDDRPSYTPSEPESAPGIDIGGDLSGGGGESGGGGASD